VSLREQMPSVAGFVEALRQAFGDELINDSLRGRGGGWFCARENGIRWCTPGRKCKGCGEEREQRA